MIIIMKKCLLALWVFALAYFFVLAGIDWGIPSAERFALVMDERMDKAALFNNLTLARKYVYKDTKSGIFSSPFRRDDELRARDRVVIDYKKDGFTLDFSNAVRHYILCSHDSDENIIFNSLANFRPSRFEFNPHLFMYGGSFLYPLAAGLKALSLAGLVQLVPDMNYYYNNVDEMGRLYTAARSFCAVVGILGVLILVLFAYQTGGSVFWPAILAVPCFLSPTIITWGKMVKPQFYICFFSGLNLIAVYYFVNTKKFKYLLASFFLCGLMFGATMVSGMFMLLPVLAYLNSSIEGRPDARRVLKDVFLGFLTAAAGILILNPYWLISPHEVIAEFQYVFSIATNTHFGLATLRNYVKYSLGEFFSVLFGISLCAGLYLRKKAGTFNFILLQFLLLTAIFVSKWPNDPASMRYSIALLPVSCFYMVEMFRLARDRQILIKSIVLVFIAFSLPYSLMHRTYCINDSTASESTRQRAGKWINDNLGSASIGHLFDIVPWRFPPITLSKHKVIVYQGIQALFADPDKPRYFVYTDIEKYQYFSKEEKARLSRLYKPVQEFTNDPELLDEMYLLFNANIPVYVMEKR